MSTMFGRERGSRPTAGQKLPQPRRVSRSLAPLVAASLVVLVAAGAYFYRHAEQSKAGVAALQAGSTWTLVGLRAEGTPAVAAMTSRVHLTFDGGGTFTGFDGMNGVSGRYRVSGHSLTLTLTTSGAQGSTRTDPVHEAMTSLLRRPGSDSVTSQFATTPARLTLEAGGWTLTFAAEKTSPMPFPPESTSQP